MRLAAACLCCVLLAGTDEAEPARISIDLREVSLEALARTVARQAGVKIFVEGPAAASLVSLTMEKATVEEVLRAAASQAETTARLGSDGVWRLGRAEGCEPWELEMGQLLRKTVARLQLDGTDLGVALRRATDTIGIEVQIDPEVLRTRKPEDLRVTLSVEKKITVRAALTRMTKQVGLAWDLRWHVVFVSTPERLERIPRRLVPSGGPDSRHAELLSRLASRRVMINLQGATVAQVVSFASSLTDVKIAWSEDARAVAMSGKVTLRAQDVSLERLLALVLLPRDLILEVAEDGFVIRKAPPAEK
jgi:hypothetical protein